MTETNGRAVWRVDRGVPSMVRVSQEVEVPGGVPALGEIPGQLAAVVSPVIHDVSDHEAPRNRDRPVISAPRH